jgi:transposase
MPRPTPIPDVERYVSFYTPFPKISMKALPITYIVRAANVNDKVLVKPLMKKASRLLRLHGKRISYFIADSQYYSEEVFKAIRRYGAEPVIPHSSKSH